MQACDSMSSKSTRSYVSKTLVEPALEQQMMSLADWARHLTVSLSFRGKNIPRTRTTDIVDRLMMATLWQEMIARRPRTSQQCMRHYWFRTRLLTSDISGLRDDGPDGQQVINVIS
eukprot:6863282-Pyramimonas_sp.AAC.1